MKMPKGQAVVELVLCVCVLVLFLSGLVKVAQTIFLRQRALEAAQLGSLLQSTGLIKDSTVHDELQNYFQQASQDQNGEWTWEIGRFLETPSSPFYHLVMTRVHGKKNSINITEKVVIETSPGG